MLSWFGKLTRQGIYLATAFLVIGFLFGSWVGRYKLPYHTPDCRDIAGEHVVEHVVDGDTITISICDKMEAVRLIGLNTPETVDPRKPPQCFGEEASREAKKLLEGKRVILETDASQGVRDRYGRPLAYVYLPNSSKLYNEYMIEQGLGHEYTYVRKYAYQERFRTAQARAKDAKVGMWHSATCALESAPPATARRQRK